VGIYKVRSFLFSFEFLRIPFYFIANLLKDFLLARIVDIIDLRYVCAFSLFQFVIHQL
jgi:hypothetical protein